MIYKILFSILLAVTLTVTALGQEVTSTDSAGEAAKKKWTITATFEHFEPLDQQNDEESQFYGDLIYRPTEGHVLRAIQAWSKSYAVAQDEDEVQVQDTLIYHYWTLHKFGEGRPTFSLRSGATIPLAEASKRQQVRSRTSLRFSLSQKLLKDKLIVSFRPYYNYQFNKFKQSPSGEPLNWYSYGYSVRADIKAFEKWTLVTVIGHGLNKRQFSGTGGSSPSEGTVTIDSFINFDATKSLALRLGITQSGSQLQAGRLEVDPFGDGQTQVYSGIDYTF